MTRKQRKILGAIATVIIVASVFGAILSTSRRNTNKMLEVWGAEERAAKVEKAAEKAADKAERESGVYYLADVGEGYGVPYPGNGRPPQQTAFPDIKDKSSLRIKLKRDGKCPGCTPYDLEVQGDGSVTFVDREARLHHATIPPQKVDQLLNAFRQADFFWLYDMYWAGAADAGGVTMSISFDDHTKVVREQWGQKMNMPAVALDLPTLIDQVVETEKHLTAKPQ